MIQKKSLAQEVADMLQHSIERGAFAINEKLPTEPELMQKFGVGRSTIREAIKYLSQSGFISVQQGLGTFVVSHSSNRDLNKKIENADYADIFEVRELLELKTVEKASENRQEKHLKKMLEALDKRLYYAENGDILSCINADIDFHTAVSESCGNTILFQLYKTMSEHVRKYLAVQYSDTSSFLESQAIHHELLEAIRRKDKSAAGRAAQKILGKI